LILQEMKLDKGAGRAPVDNSIRVYFLML